MTLPADKRDAFLAGVVQMESVLTGPDGRTGGIATQVTQLEPVVGDMDTQRRRIEAGPAALHDGMPHIPRAVPLLWLALAAAVVLLAVSVGS